MATGIVAEFNPFHNGHKYLINEVKRRTNGDPIVAVMSGAWVQRGEPAITDKHTRTRMALENGVDLVLELPVTFSMNTAQKFAQGAVSILAATGVVSSLAFGSESGNIALLEHTAQTLLNEPRQVSEKIKEFVSQGMSFAAARTKAYEGFIPADILTSPNDILAVEYLRAAAELGSGTDHIAIKRKGASHDGTAEGNISSASEIRTFISNGCDASRYMPVRSFPVYNKNILDTTVIARIRTMSENDIKNINDVSEGLENRFIRSAAKASTFDELCMGVKSKRYALSRIRRIAYSALLGITKEYTKLPPSYIRVLGMNADGAKLLKQMKITAALPVIIKPSGGCGDKIFDLNSRAEDIFALCAPDPSLRHGKRDLTTSPVTLIR